MGTCASGFGACCTCKKFYHNIYFQLLFKFVYKQCKNAQYCVQYLYLPSSYVFSKFQSSKDVVVLREKIIHIFPHLDFPPLVQLRYVSNHLPQYRYKIKSLKKIGHNIFTISANMFYTFESQACKIDDSICQIRLDFSKFVSSQPELSTTPTVTNCIDSRFSVGAHGETHTICGTNTGQHCKIANAKI